MVELTAERLQELVEFYVSEVPEDLSDMVTQSLATHWEAHPEEFDELWLQYLQSIAES